MITKSRSVFLALLVGMTLGIGLRPAATLRAEAAPVQSISTLRDGIWTGLIEPQASPNLSVKSVSLVVAFSGSLVAIPDQNITLSPYNIARTELIQFNGSIMSVKQGVDATDCPSPDAGCIPLCLVKAPANATAINDIGSYLITGRGNIVAYYFSAKGLYYASNFGGTSVYFPAEGIYEFGYQATLQQTPSSGSYSTFNLIGYSRSHYVSALSTNEASFVVVKKMPAGVSSISVNLTSGTSIVSNQWKWWVRSIN